MALSERCKCIDKQVKIGTRKTVPGPHKNALSVKGFSCIVTKFANLVQLVGLAESITLEQRSLDQTKPNL